MTNAHETIARLLIDAHRAGASADVVADLWARRAMPATDQALRLPELQQMRAEWRAAGLLAG